MDDRPVDGAIAHNPPEDDRPIEGMSALMLRWFELFYFWDFIVADVTEEKPDWKTVSQHPLNAQTLYLRWQRPDELIGVRFATKRPFKTSYLMLDIDFGSQYHPRVGMDGLWTILRALEDIGLCRFLRIRSSPSGGIHLYFPFSKAVFCPGLAWAVKRTLEVKGIRVSQGQLEVFPNVRSSRLYQGHRLPLQVGSYVLGDDWQPLHASLEGLIDLWNMVATCQDMERLETAIAFYQHEKRDKVSRDRQEWQLRLETTLREGWTDKGQTNRILKELCIYARVFEEKGWDEVERWVLRTALELPGYKQHCRHQRHIKRRIREWVKTNRKSNRYYPVGKASKRRFRELPKAPTNEERKKDARKRIQEAIATLIQELGSLPTGAKKRQELICEKAGCSATTLYSYKQLWHPEYDLEGCVTPSFTRLSVVFDIPQPLEQECSGCVTLHPVGVSAIAKEFLNDLNVAETQEGQGFTHPILLSVNSKEDLRETPEALKAIPQLRPNDLVRWKTYDTTFRIRKVNSNGTVWAKRLNYPVQLVDAVLKISELELIQPQDVDSNIRREANGL